MRSHRPLALFVLAIGATFVGASCREVVAGEDTRQAVGELCDTLERCYGDEFDCDHITARFGRDQADDQSFLTEFDEPCTESCPGARGCLERTPICADANEPCGSTAGCCGAGLGLLRCEPQSPEALGPSSGGECCIPDGVECESESDVDTCCTSCLPVGNGYFCGGFECKTENEACRNSLECCSRYCALSEDGATRTCQRKTCADLGEACLSTADCCPAEVQSNVAPPVVECLETGVCGYAGEAKGLAGDPCSGDEDCESNQCFPVEGSDERRCAGVDGCLPELVDCQSDADCCQGGEAGVPEGATPLLCNLAAATPRCEPNFTCIDAAGCCQIAGSPCEADADCCSDSCAPNGLCESSLSPACAVRVCHPLCQVGAPMGVELEGMVEPPSACTQGGARAACIEEVLKADDFCGCFQWDQVCVELARTLCEAGGDPCLL
jgi:hypothetical protein